MALNLQKFLAQSCILLPPLLALSFPNVQCELLKLSFYFQTLSSLVLGNPVTILPDVEASVF